MYARIPIVCADSKITIADRLDSKFDWIYAAPPSGKLDLVRFGNGCSDPVPYNIEGEAALIVRTDSDCSFAELIR